jgi:hypothetical protein
MLDTNMYLVANKKDFMNRSFYYLLFIFNSVCMYSKLCGGSSFISVGMYSKLYGEELAFISMYS